MIDDRDGRPADRCRIVLAAGHRNELQGHGVYHDERPRECAGFCTGNGMSEECRRKKRDEDALAKVVKGREMIDCHDCDSAEKPRQGFCFSIKSTLTIGVVGIKVLR